MIWLSRLRAAFLLPALLCFTAAAHAQIGSGCPQITQAKIVSDSTYQLSNNDRCWLVVLTAAGNITVQLPTPNLIFSPGWTSALLPINGGQVTLSVVADPGTGRRANVNMPSSSGAQFSTNLTPAGTGGQVMILQDSNWWAWATGGGAGGNVTGPNTTTVGHLTSWNNTGGSLLADGGIPVQGNFLPVGNALSTNGVLMPSMTAISATLREFAFASGITSSQPLGANAGQNNDKVAIYGGAVANHSGGTNDANIWGANFLVTAAAGYTGTAQGIEVDVNGLSAAASSYKAIALTGNFTAVPAIADAAECGIVAATNPWSYCFWSFDGAALNFAHIGTLSTGNNTGSQPIVAASRDSGGVNRTSTIATDAGGDWVINPAVSLIVTPPGANNLSVRGATYQLDLRGTPVTLATGSYMASHLAANPATAEPLEINATVLQLDGAVVVGTPTGADKGGGSINIAGSIWTNGVQGVTCNAAPSVNWRAVNGITTVC